MDESILKDYLYAYDQYKNINKEDKIRKYELLQIEKDSLEKNRTKINDRKGPQIVATVFGTITILFTMMKAFGGNIGYELLIYFIMFVMLAAGLFYIYRNDKSIEKEKEEFEKEKNRVNEINIESLAIKNLLMDQYHHTI